MYRKSKLRLSGDGPFQVLEKMNDNSYELDLPENYSVSPKFNVHALMPYLEDDVGAKDSVDLRANPFQQGGYDVSHHERFDPKSPREEELEFESPMMSYNGLIT